jgi:hypothetical protein
MTKTVGIKLPTNCLFFCRSNSFHIQGDSRVIMSLTKFVMQPTLHFYGLCEFKKYIFLYNVVIMSGISFGKFNKNHYVEY